MNLLKKCKECKIYTFKEECPKCLNKTTDAHYKYREKFIRDSK
jgi:rRNA maturation protein Nop10